MRIIGTGIRGGVRSSSEWDGRGDEVCLQGAECGIGSHMGSLLHPTGREVWLWSFHRDSLLNGGESVFCGGSPSTSLQGSMLSASPLAWTGNRRHSLHHFQALLRRWHSRLHQSPISSGSPRQHLWPPCCRRHSSKDPLRRLRRRVLPSQGLPWQGTPKPLPQLHIPAPSAVLPELACCHGGWVHVAAAAATAAAAIS